MYYAAQVMNEAYDKKLCLDNLQRNEDNMYHLGQYPCHPQLAMSQVRHFIPYSFTHNLFFTFYLLVIVFCAELGWDATPRGVVRPSA